jgi:GNAT superfamily N-acetyltransferase
MTLVVGPAVSPRDLEVAAEILDEAASWLAERGLPGWEPASFRKPGTFEHEALLSVYRSGDLYLAQEDGHPVATVSLLWEDVIYWPDAPPVAVYVHRFAVRRDAAGRRLGLLVLEWVEDEARKRGRAYVRLNCMTDDAGIRAYYERAGFAHFRDLRIRGFDMSLYEKPISARR